MTALRVLVIEDNRDLAANLVDFLAAKGHAVDAAGDGITGMHLAVANDYDAIVLDLVLPGMNGITLCRKLREEAGRQTPVLMLTARDSLDDKIVGLEAGADDYVVKPFALREVEARLKALVRRAQGGSRQQQLQVGDLGFDTGTYRVVRGSRSIDLPPIPLRILELLMRAAPRVLSRQEIERALWGDTPPDSDALRAHMHVLRSAIDKPFEKPLLRTLRGVGWQLADDDAPAR
ncbi:MAG: two component transcriptional regulator [Proteobacteria bacterium]|jgi:DNA-binding response OmpR family regulator|nr:two component transcriptional regulator [Pseudomonadota bacterium]